MCRYASTAIAIISYSLCSLCLGAAGMKVSMKKRFVLYPLLPLLAATVGGGEGARGSRISYFTTCCSSHYESWNLEPEIILSLRIYFFHHAPIFTSGAAYVSWLSLSTRRYVPTKKSEWPRSMFHDTYWPLWMERAKRMRGERKERQWHGRLKKSMQKPLCKWNLLGFCCYIIIILFSGHRNFYHWKRFIGWEIPLWPNKIPIINIQKHNDVEITWWIGRFLDYMLIKMVSLFMTGPSFHFGHVRSL